MSDIILLVCLVCFDLVLIFDAVDSYRWRHRMPVILAAEMIKQTEEALNEVSFEYGQDYE